MAAGNDSVSRYFEERDGRERGEVLHDAAYRLARTALAGGDSGGFDRLMSLCASPENLRTWLPSMADRIHFAEGLRRGLRDVNAGGTCEATDSESLPTTHEVCGIAGMLKIWSSNGHPRLDRGRFDRTIVGQ